MSVASADEITKALTALQASARGVNAVLLASTEGRLLGSTIASGTERVQLSAISAAALAIAGKGVRDLHLGDLAQVTIRGKAGAILLFSLGQKAVLSLVLADGVSPEPVIEAGRSALRNLESMM